MLNPNWRDHCPHYALWESRNYRGTLLLHCVECKRGVAVRRVYAEPERAKHRGNLYVNESKLVRSRSWSLSTASGQATNEGGFNG